VIVTSIQAPNANAHAERVIETIRAECLADWTLILGRRHFDWTLRTHAAHYANLVGSGIGGRDFSRNSWVIAAGGTPTPSPTLRRVGRRGPDRHRPRPRSGGPGRCWPWARRRIDARSFRSRPRGPRRRPCSASSATTRRTSVRMGRPAVGIHYASQPRRPTIPGACLFGAPVCPCGLAASLALSFV
jgi:hypothetical protein